MGLRLHSKYGVNPTVPKCFWCGESKNEVVLLGSSYKGEAPLSMVMNYEPCDKCKSMWDMGITFIEATRVPNTTGQPSMSKQYQAYPTGRMSVVKEEAVRRVIADEGMLQDVLKQRIAFMEPEAYSKMLGGADDEQD